tara:strand:- start:176 stop:676 length:501 start_codon:yes stop_codon:yes gene_type:complete
MSLAVFNTQENLFELEKYKLLPYELQDYIADYTEEGYNKKCFNYDWYNIIETVGSKYGWEYWIRFLNKHLTEKIITPRERPDCKNMTGYSHTCLQFITCDEKISIGFYYGFVKMNPGKKYIWEDDLVDNKEATQLIIDKTNEYINSNKYDPSVMYKINKKLLDNYP